MQKITLLVGKATFVIEIPAPDSKVVADVCWGAVDAFPSLAYWAFQVHARRLEGKRINYKLGTTLQEEVAACLLGGHGIAAHIGVAAFQYLKKCGAFSEVPPTEQELQLWLSAPIPIGKKTVNYRFARQKAKYIYAALQAIHQTVPPTDSGKSLRDWLLQLPGIGYKTGSWIARNWLDADDVAILDIHILRAGMLGGFFKKGLSVERHYLELEHQFLRVSKGMGVQPSELDAVIWYEMMCSRATVHSALARCT